MQPQGIFITVATEHYRSSGALCQLPWRNPSLNYLLGMPGPPRFDPAMGDRRAGPPPSINLVPRERTQDSPGASASTIPVRLSPGPCATLPPDVTEDPKVARLVPSTYTVM